jgi:hypothetical protein
MIFLKLKEPFTCPRKPRVEITLDVCENLVHSADRRFINQTKTGGDRYEEVS